MPKTRTYKSEAMAAIHESISGLYDAGLVDKQTMREFDEGCLTPVHEFTAAEIRALRESEAVSQTVFARYIGVTRDSVSQWERGQKRPNGPSLKLLSLIKHKGLVEKRWVSDSYRTLTFNFDGDSGNITSKIISQIAKANSTNSHIG